jgi:integrase
LPRSDRSPRRRLRKAQREWGWLDAIPTLRLREESQRRVRWITQEEASRLLAELPEHVADMAEFSLSTGLRLANVTGLTWNQIDLGRRLVIL